MSNSTSRDGFGGNGEIDHIAAQGEFLEILEHGTVPSRKVSKGYLTPTRKAGSLSLERLSIRLTLPVSLPGLTGQSSNPGRWLLDRPVKPWSSRAMTAQR